MSYFIKAGLWSKKAIGLRGELNLDDISTEITYPVLGGTDGTQPTFNGDPLFSASYVLQRPLVHFWIKVEMSNITSFGTGNYYMTVPFNSKYDTIIAGGHIHDSSRADDYQLTGDIDAGTNIMKLKYQGGNGQLLPFTSTNPRILATDDFFHIAGFYIIE